MQSAGLAGAIYEIFEAIYNCCFLLVDLRICVARGGELCLLTYYVHEQIVRSRIFRQRESDPYRSQVYIAQTRNRY